MCDNNKCDNNGHVRPSRGHREPPAPSYSSRTYAITDVTMCVHIKFAQRTFTRVLQNIPPAPVTLGMLKRPHHHLVGIYSPQSRRVSSAPTSRSPLSAVYFIPTTRILLPISAHGGSGSCVQLAMGACSTDRMCCRGGGHTRPTSRRCSVGCSHRMTTSNTS